jgi:hypothetical protein
MLSVTRWLGLQMVCGESAESSNVSMEGLRDLYGGQVLGLQLQG